MAWFLSRIYWSSLDHDLMASIGEKASSILAGNLNSGSSYLITAVPEIVSPNCDPVACLNTCASSPNSLIIVYAETTEVCKMAI